MGQLSKVHCRCPTSEPWQPVMREDAGSAIPLWHASVMMGHHGGIESLHSISEAAEPRAHDRLASQRRQSTRTRRACLDIATGIEAIHLIQQLQHGPLDLALAAGLRLISLGPDGVNLICIDGALSAFPLCSAGSCAGHHALQSRHCASAPSEQSLPTLL